MTNIRIKKTEGSEESVELLAQSVIQVAEGFERIMAGPLTEGALVALIRAGIGESKISRSQIKLVLEALPRLKGWYIKKN